MVAVNLVVFIEKVDAWNEVHQRIHWFSARDVVGNDHSDRYSDIHSSVNHFNNYAVSYNESMWMED